jgi:succinyl-CoA synthetase beta subunit
VKAQILAGGRGKGVFDNGFKGGVHLCNTYAPPLCAKYFFIALHGPSGAWRSLTQSLVVGATNSALRRLRS